jgi:hypothetical protein
MSTPENPNPPESNELLKAKLDDAVTRLTQLDSNYFHLRKEYRELRKKYDKVAVFADQVKESLRELN